MKPKYIEKLNGFNIHMYSILISEIGNENITKERVKKCLEECDIEFDDDLLSSLVTALKEEVVVFGEGGKVPTGYKYYIEGKVDGFVYVAFTKYDMREIFDTSY